MNEADWRRARALFDDVADLPPADQQARLDAVRAAEPAIAAEVAALLETDQVSDAQLVDAVAHVAAALGADDGPAVDPTIGPYRLERELARGGMGTVYLAHRDDDEFRRAVAIKLIRGWADDELVRRFRVERQILADLDHPNIARLLDGGATRSGLPYLVMEYVDGQPIGAYCDQARLSVADRVRLAETLCRAVQYAHERGVIHRDLKPGNVLVTADGVPKLLDFGIARLFDASAPASPAGGDTTPGTDRMTPEYASPEQALGLPVTTASDVYVLGLMLYELLTGVRPQQPTTYRHEDVVRAVAEVIPPRPSDTLRRRRPSTPPGTSGDGTPSTAVDVGEASAARQSTPERLARALTGDLDRIVLKAIAKEPAARYSSASALADDLRRHLAGEPVLARAASVTYILRRRLRRHWPSAAAAGVVLALVGAQGLYWYASRAAARAEVDAAQRFGAQVERLGLDLRIERALPLHDIRPANLRVRARIADVERRVGAADGPAYGPGYYAVGAGHLALGENARARDALARAWDVGYRPPEVARSLGLAYGRLYREALLEIDSVGNPEQRARRRADAQATLRDPAVRYLRMGQQDPDFATYTASLIDFFEGDLDGAVAKAAAARDQVGWLYETLLLEGDVALERAVGFAGTGEFAGARQSIAEAIGLYTRAADAARSDPVPYGRLCALGGIQMGLELDIGDGVPQAVEAALDSCRKAIAADPDLVQPHVDMARTYWNLGTWQRRHGGDPLPPLEQAITSARAAIAIDPSSAPAHLHLGTALQQRGARELDTGADPRATFAASIAAYQEAADLGLDDASLHNSLANAYAYLGDWERFNGLDPRRTMEAAILEYRRSSDRDPANALPFGNLGIALKDLALYEAGHGRDPLPLLRDSVAAYEAALQRNPNHAPTLNNAAQSWYRIGLAQFDRGEDPAPALDRADASIDGAIAVNAAYATPYVNRAEVGLARAAVLVADGGDPRAVLERSRVSLRRALAINPGNRAQFYAHSARVELAEARWELGQGGAVGPLVERARAFARQMRQVNPEDADAWELVALAGVVEARGRMRQGASPGDALASARAAIGQALDADPDAPWYVASALEIQLCALEAAGGDGAMSDLVAARDLASKALQRKPDAFRVRAFDAVLLARIARLSGDAALGRQAAAALEAALAASPPLAREFAPYRSR
ncbi:MAG: protein kinase [Vicinamibacterales bacterium]